MSPYNQLHYLHITHYTAPIQHTTLSPYNTLRTSSPYNTHTALFRYVTRTLSQYNKLYTRCLHATHYNVPIQSINNGLHLYISSVQHKGVIYEEIDQVYMQIFLI